MNKFEMYLERFVAYIRETYLNKIVALAVILLGVLAMNVRGDGTFLLIALMFCVPLFFTTKNYIHWE